MAAPQGAVQVYNVTASPKLLLLSGTLDASGNITLNDSSLPQGTYNVQAWYLGQGQDQPSQSAPVQITVGPPALSTTTNMTVSPINSNQGDTVTFTISVTQP